MNQNEAIPPPAGTPAVNELCGYRVTKLLSPTDAPPTFLAAGPGGRAVVLKALENECILRKGALHPNIRDRLGRVRELALLGVAALYGVERDADRPQAGYTAWQVWEYLPGQTLDEFFANPNHTDGQSAAVARELVLVVESLHAQGIVHGSIRGGNVIVGPDAGVRLTHVSPLLYTDPAEDAQAVVETLADAVARRGGEQTPLGVLFSEAMRDGGGKSLRSLGAQLAALGTRRDSSPADRAGRRREGGARWQSLAGAAGVAGMGLAAAYGIQAWVGRPPVPTTQAPPEAVDVRPVK